MQPFDAEFLRLNDQQQQAVQHRDGPSVVSATAGAGKTATVALRIWHLARTGVRPDRILATTFSRAGASAIAERLRSLGAPTDLRIGTLHSVCLEIQRQDGRQFCEGFETDAKDKLRYDLKRLVTDKFRGTNFKDALLFISFAKAAGLWAPEGYDNALVEGLFQVARELDLSHQSSQLLKIYKAFEELRIERKLLSFDDMLLGAWRTFCEVPGAKELWQERFDYAIVDEAQDTSRVQYSVVKTLMGKTNNLMIVGDVCQSLYAWRGAAPKEFIEFASQPGCVLYKLPVNYRSPRAITEPASMLVRGRAWNLTGDIVPVHEDPADVVAYIYGSPEEEARGLVQDLRTRLLDGAKPGEVFMLFRMNAIAQPLESELVRAGIPYRLLSGTGFYGRREIKDMLAYLHVVALRDRRGYSAKRIVNVPFRYIGKVTISELETLAETQKISFLDTCVAYRGRPQVRRSLDELLEIVRDLNAMVVANAPAGEVLEELLDRTKYIEWLKRDDADDDAEVDREANVLELLRLAKYFPTINAFLDYVDATEAALAAARAAGEARPDVVTLMSVYRAKGLEADHVYVAGAVTGIMPHPKNRDPDEERRVMFVALTRARKSCTFGCPQRTLYGKEALPSPFLREMGVKVVGELREPLNAPGDTEVLEQEGL